MEVVTHDGVEYRAGPAFGSEEEAQEWGGPVLTLWYPLRGTVSGPHTGPFKGYADYAPLHPRPKAFADAREGLGHLLAPGGVAVGTNTGATYIMAPSGDVIRTWANGESGRVYVDDWTNLRPYCPVWDAPKPTAEEDRREAVVDLRGDLSGLLSSYGVSSTWTSSHGGEVQRSICGPDGIGLVIDLRNCHKPATQ